MHFVAFLGLMTFLPLTDYLESNCVWNMQFGLNKACGLISLSAVQEFML